MARKETKGKNADGEPISAEAKALVDWMIKTWKHQPKEKRVKVKEAHLSALDDIVSVNSLFMFAVFVGISMAARGQQSLETREECQAGIEYKKILLLFEVIAFACFVLSCLVAKVIKLLLIIDGEGKHCKLVRRDLFDLKDFMLILVASTSVAGIVLVTLSIVYVVQIRMGLLSCGSATVRCVVLSLSIIVGVGLIIYVVSMAIAIFASLKSDALADAASEGDKSKTTTDHSSDEKSVYFQFQAGGSGGNRLIRCFCK